MTVTTPSITTPNFATGGSAPSSGFRSNMAPQALNFQAAPAPAPLFVGATISGTNANNQAFDHQKTSGVQSSSRQLQRQPSGDQQFQTPNIRPAPAARQFCGSAAFSASRGEAAAFASGGPRSFASGAPPPGAVQSTGGVFHRPPGGSPFVPPRATGGSFCVSAPAASDSVSNKRPLPPSQSSSPEHHAGERRDGALSSCSPPKTKAGSVRADARTAQLARVCRKHLLAAPGASPEKANEIAQCLWADDSSPADRVGFSANRLSGQRASVQPRTHFTYARKYSKGLYRKFGSYRFLSVWVRRQAGKGVLQRNDVCPEWLESIPDFNGWRYELLCASSKEGSGRSQLFQDLEKTKIEAAAMEDDESEDEMEEDDPILEHVHATTGLDRKKQEGTPGKMALRSDMAMRDHLEAKDFHVLVYFAVRDNHQVASDRRPPDPAECGFRWGAVVNEDTRLDLLKPVSILDVYRFHCHTYSNVRTLIRSGKLTRRLKLGFTDTIPTTVVEPEGILSVPDKESEDANYPGGAGVVCNDGHGLLSYELADAVRRELGLEYVPSTFQLRFGNGIKGMFTVSKRMRGKKLQISASQRKFEIDWKTVEKLLRTVEVKAWSPEKVKPLSSGLSHQVLLILEALARSNGTLEKLEKFLEREQRKKLEEAENHFENAEQLLTSLPRHKTCDADTRLLKELLRAGFELHDAPFLAAAGIAYHQRTVVDRALRDEKLFVPECYHVYVVGDEDGLLEPHEAIFRRNSVVHDGAVLATRIPANLLPDVQKYRCLSEVEIFERAERLLGRGLSYSHDNVLVLSTKAHQFEGRTGVDGRLRRARAPVDLSSGGDMDGDKFLVICCGELVDMIHCCTYSEAAEALMLAPGQAKGEQNNPSMKAISAGHAGVAGGRGATATKASPHETHTNLRALVPPRAPEISTELDDEMKCAICREITEAQMCQNKVGTWFTAWKAFADALGAQHEFAEAAGWCAQEAIDGRLTNNVEDHVIRVIRMHLDSGRYARETGQYEGKDPERMERDRALVLQILSSSDAMFGGAVGSCPPASSSSRPPSFKLKKPDWDKSALGLLRSGASPRDAEDLYYRSGSVLGKLKRKMREYAESGFFRRVMYRAFEYQLAGDPAVDPWLTPAHFEDDDQENVAKEVREERGPKCDLKTYFERAEQKSGSSRAETLWTRMGYTPGVSHLQDAGNLLSRSQSQSHDSLSLRGQFAGSLNVVAEGAGGTSAKNVNACSTSTKVAAAEQRGQFHCAPPMQNGWFGEQMVSSGSARGPTQKKARVDGECMSAPPAPSNFTNVLASTTSSSTANQFQFSSTASSAFASGTAARSRFPSAALFPASAAASSAPVTSYPPPNVVPASQGAMFLPSATSAGFTPSFAVAALGFAEPHEESVEMDDSRMMVNETLNATIDLDVEMAEHVASQQRPGYAFSQVALHEASSGSPNLSSGTMAEKKARFSEDRRLDAHFCKWIPEQFRTYFPDRDKEIWDAIYTKVSCTREGEKLHVPPNDRDHKAEERARAQLLELVESIEERRRCASSTTTSGVVSVSVAAAPFPTTTPARKKTGAGQRAPLLPVPEKDAGVYMARRRDLRRSVAAACYRAYMQVVERRRFDKEKRGQAPNNARWGNYYKTMARIPFVLFQDELTEMRGVEGGRILVAKKYA